MKMTGWKTWVAGIGSMVAGVGTIISALGSDMPAGDGISSGIGMIVAGLAVIGIGHKIEKGGSK